MVVPLYLQSRFSVLKMTGLTPHSLLDLDGAYIETWGGTEMCLKGLPTGRCFVQVLRRDGDFIIEAQLRIGEHVVRLLSGEVEPGWNDDFSIVEADESVLLQLNGQPLPPT